MSSIRAYRLVETLQERGHDVLLTGGLAVEAWSGKTFQSDDWDIVGGPYVDYDAVIDTLRDLGYEKRGNSWYLVDGEFPARNKGEFITTQYPWGKTFETTITIYHAEKDPKPDINIECVCPEWLFTDRVVKAEAGQVVYAEQALFLNEQFRKGSSYQWSPQLEQHIAEDRSVPESHRTEQWLCEVAGQTDDENQSSDQDVDDDLSI